jgi:hypothetical protein
VTSLAAARVAPLPAGARGFDINRPLSAAEVRAFAKDGFAFVDRYVWRVMPHGNDLSAEEVERILGNGLGLSVSQHYEGDDWTPSETKGVQYGAAAVAACRSLSLPMGVTVSLDLEGIKVGVPADDVIGYASAWCSAVLNGGYLAQCYFGWHCVLTGEQLYRLPFERYRSAYNANADQFPLPRGACMRQRSAKQIDIPAGLTIEPYQIDLDIVTGDLLGGFPTALMPGPGVVA